MGPSRTFYASLLDPRRIVASNPELQTALDEIAAGQTSFGPSEEWTAWLHALMARIPSLIGTGRVDLIYEACVTAIFGRYPSGRSDAPYAEFFDDLLLVLGADFVREALWSASPRVACVSGERVAWEGSVEPGGQFSAALYLAAKYTSEEGLTTWWRSIIAVDTPCWRAHVLLWMAAASELLTRPGAQPAQFTHTRTVFRDSLWQGAEWLKGTYPDAHGTPRSHPFLDEARQKAIVDVFRASLDGETLLHWLTAIEAAATPGSDEALILQSELYEALEHCIAAYDLRRR